MNYIVNPIDQQAVEAAQARWNAVAKPLNSLGQFEKMVCRIAGVQKTADVSLSPRCAVMFCGDHGVIEEGVTQSGSEVTALVAASAAQGSANVNHMAHVAGADVFVVDAGMKGDAAGVIGKKIARGTRNMTKGSAMTREQAEAAVQAGIDVVRDLKERGYRLIATGEMGIGNTTASTAITCAFLGIAPEEVTGRGAGLSDDGLKRKISAIKRALEVNAPDPSDALDVLSKVGGFEIAAMAGAFIGGMTYGIPVVIDGVISASAALAAARLCPSAVDFMLPSHMSREGASPRIMAALGLRPVIDADMALGEGTGAVMLFPMLDMALKVYNSVHTFEQLGMEAYQPQEGQK